MSIDTMTPTICLIGGSGFVGRHVACKLSQQGYALRIPTRRRERAKSRLIVLPNTELIEADVGNGTALADIVSGCAAVINFTGILHENHHGDFRRIHAELPRKIVDACRSNGVSRLLHVSALKAAHDAPSEYLRSKAAGEQQIRAAEANGVHTTIFRPSVIFGQDDTFLNRFAAIASMFPVIPLGCPDARFQPVFVEDVAREIANSVFSSSAFSRTYDLCGPRVYRLQELVAYTSGICGHSRKIVPLSPAMSRLQAWLFERLPGKLITLDNLSSMQVDNVCEEPSNAPPDFDPQAIEAVVPLYLSGKVSSSRLDRYRVRAGRAL